MLLQRTVKMNKCLLQCDAGDVRAPQLHLPRDGFAHESNSRAPAGMPPALLPTSPTPAIPRLPSRDGQATSDPPCSDTMKSGTRGQLRSVPSGWLQPKPEYRHHRPAHLVRRMPSRSIASAAEPSRKPAVSDTIIGSPPSTNGASTTSRVVPATGDTIAASRPASQFSSDDFPTFGAPASTTRRPRA